MINFTKEEVLDEYRARDQEPPQWVLDAADDALFAQGSTLGGHVPLHIVGDDPPAPVPGMLSIALP